VTKKRGIRLATTSTSLLARGDVQKNVENRWGGKRAGTKKKMATVSDFKKRRSIKVEVMATEPSSESREEGKNLGAARARSSWKKGGAPKEGEKDRAMATGFVASLTWITLGNFSTTEGTIVIGEGMRSATGQKGRNLVTGRRSS